MEGDTVSPQCSQNDLRENKSVPEQVLEYYTKYSLNRELPKYFCGNPNLGVTNWHHTDVQPVTKGLNGSLKEKPPVITIDKISENSNDDPNIIASSPASSVTSNRKLEWDNGADIGYSNVTVNRTLQKSISLPILNNSEYKILQDKLLGKPAFRDFIEAPQHSTDSASNGEVQDTFIESSSSSSNRMPQRSNSVSSSTTSPLQRPLSSDTDSFNAVDECSLPKKIGIPIAESTVYNANSPCVKSKQTFSVDTVDKISNYKHIKMLTLAISKPVVVECVRNLSKLKNAKSKQIQTSFVKNVSVAIQTEPSHYLEKLVRRKCDEQQSVFFMYHSDFENEKATNSSSIQTSENDSEILSNNCQSFEFLCGDNLNDGVNNGNNLKNFSPCTDLTSSSSPQTSNNSNCMPNSPLAQLLMTHESTYRITDFQNKIKLLQKMLNSCKYTDSTKKFYLKQVLNKLFNAKYVDDTTCENIEKTLPIDDKKDQLLHNKPWAPVQATKNFQIETFFNEIAPQQNSSRTQFIPIHKPRRIRNQLLTLTSYQPILNDDNKTNSLPLSKTESLCESSNELTSSQSCKTWRDDKTRSEQMLEKVGDGDSVTNKLAPKDFEDDLLWINKEIMHLNKLKKKLKRNNMNDLLHKPQNFKGSDKPTSVYVLTTEEKDPVCRNSVRVCTHPRCIRYQRLAKQNVCICLQSSPPSSEQTDNYQVNPPREFPESSRYQGSEEIPNNSNYPPVIQPNSPKLNSLISKYSVQETSSTSVTKKQLPNSHLKPDLQCTNAPVGFSKYKRRSSQQSIQITSTPFTRTDGISEISKDSHDIHTTKRTSPQFLGVNEEKVESKNPTHSYIQEIVVDLPINRNANKCSGNGCKSCCRTHNCRSPHLVQQLVSVESIQSENHMVPHSQQMQHHSEISKTKKCNTLCPSCLKKLDHNVVTNARYTVENAIYSFENNKDGYFDQNEDCISGANRDNCVCTNEAVANDMESQTNTHQEVATQVLCDISTCKKSTNDVPTALDKRTQTSNSLINLSPKHSTASTSSQSSSSSSIGTSSTPEVCMPVVIQSCKCCNRKLDMPSTANAITKNELCQPCYNRNRQTPYYTYPGNVCRCYNQNTQILKEIRDTVKELNTLENDNHCKCLNSSKQTGSNYCVKCKGKVKPKHVHKKAIAYMLTIQPDNKKHKIVKKHKKPLEEIKIKVPSYIRKISTSSSDEDIDKENLKKRYKDDKNSHKKKHKKQTLQDYLFVNKPDFIASAEERRRCLIDLAYVREQRCLKYKQLLGALTDITLKNGIPFQCKLPNNHDFNTRHLFTAAEMKQITAKHYKKLPEVQKKLIDHRDRQVKRANKLLTDIFNQKLRQQALSGKLSIPITTSIIRLD